MLESVATARETDTETEVWTPRTAFPKTAPMESTIGCECSLHGNLTTTRDTSTQTLLRWEGERGKNSEKQKRYVRRGVDQTNTENQRQKTTAYTLHHTSRAPPPLPL